MIVTGDLDNLDDLVELFDQYRIFYNKESDKVGAKKFLTERIQNKESIIFICYEDNIAKGFTQLYPKYSSAGMTQDWILNDLYVIEAARKSGIGTQLILAAVNFTLSKEANYVQLSTQVDNVVAQKLYIDMGFELQEPGTEFLLFKKFI